VYAYNNTGSFEFKYSIPESYYDDRLFADFNGDGKSDFFFYNWQDKTWKLWIDKDKSFTRTNDNWTEIFSLIDFNGNGKADIMVYQLTGGYKIFEFIHNTFIEIYSSSGVIAYHKIQFRKNSDGIPDYLSLNRESGYFQFHTGTGTQYLTTDGPMGRYKYSAPEMLLMQMEEVTGYVYPPPVPENVLSVKNFYAFDLNNDGSFEQ